MNLTIAYCVIFVEPLDFCFIVQWSSARNRMMRVHLEADPSLADNLKLWRYMDLTKLISLLDKEAIWLARTDTFADKQEGFFPDEMQARLEQVFETMKESPSVVKDSADFRDCLLKNTFISCWHKNADENLVMWEVFGRSKDAVAIQTSVGMLKHSVNSSSLQGHSLLLKPVQYQRGDEVKGILSYEECFFRKRPHFRFEQEVRISLDTYNPAHPKRDTPRGHYLPVFLANLVEAIYIHPDCDSLFADVVNSVATRYGLRANVKRGVYGNS